MFDDKEIVVDSGIDIQKYLDIMIRQKKFILVFSVSAILFALALTYIFSEKYNAATTVFYHPSEVSLLRQKTTEAFGSPVPTASFKVIGQTLRDAVKSPTILMPTVEKLGLHLKIEVEYDQWYKRWYHKTKDFTKNLLSDSWSILKHGRLIEEDPILGAMKTLAKNIDISATKESYIYVLMVKDKYPQRAANIVDTAGKILVQWVKEQDRDSAQVRSVQLQQQMVDQEREIKSLRSTREQILDENKYVSIAEETSKGVENLYTMKLEKNQIEIKIGKKQKELEEYSRNIQKQSLNFFSSDDLKTMKSEKLFGEIELEGMIAERDSLEALINKTNQTLGKLPQLQNELDDIDMKIEAKTREYYQLMDFYVEASGQASSIPSEIRLLSSAFVSEKPVQPIKIYHVGLTALLAFMFSIGMVYFMDYLNINTFLSPVAMEDDQGQQGYISGSSPATRFSDLLEDFSRHMSLEGGSLFLRQEDSLVLAKSLDPDHVPLEIPFPLKEGSIFERVMSSGEPVLIDDIEQRSELQSSGWKGYKDKSLLVLPVNDEKGDTVGLISLHNKKIPPLSTKDMELGTTLMSYHTSTGEIQTPIVSRACNSQVPKGIEKHLHPLTRFLLIGIGGLILGLLTFYLLRKVGY